ncbi:MAG: YdhR family protein [Vicinamibacterales bacterium]
MIATLVLFQTNGTLTLDETAARFNTTAPNYRGRDGLHTKAYIYAEDGSKLGGFYLWESREAAEALYTDAWRARATELYGVEPVVKYFEAPVLIENGAAVGAAS